MENLKLLSKVALSFQDLNNFDRDMNNTLGEIGKHLDISRIYVFLKEDNVLQNVFEWCNESIDSKIDSLKTKLNRDKCWDKQFQSKSHITTNGNSKGSKLVTDEVNKYGIKSLLAYPIAVEDYIQGFISIEESRWQRDWSEEENHLISAVSGILASVYKRKLMRENLNLFSKLFKNNPLPMSITDRETREIVDINPEFLSKTGYLRDEIIGVKVEELQTFEEPNIIEDIRNELKIKNNVEARKLVIKHKDGNYLHGIISIEIIIYKKREALLMIMVDVTSEVNLRRDLEDKLKKLRNIIDGAKLGTWEWDIRTDEFNLNDKAISMLGYEPEEFGTINIEKWKELIHPEDLKKSREIIKQHINGELDGYDLELRMKHKTGRWIWSASRGRVVDWDEKGNTIKMFGTSLDITTRKEQGLELQRFFYVNLDLLCITELDGRFIKTNKAWEEILGYSSEELKGENIIEFLHEDDIERTKKALSKLEKNNEVKEFVNRYKSTNGKYRYIEWKANRYENVIYAAARDITDRIEYENRILDMSNRDVLTNAYNRKYVYESAERLIEKCRRTKGTFSVAILDIDHFKDINDNYGHQVGDEVLKSFTKIIDENLRKYDILGRYGGEEFIVVLDDTNIRMANIIMERILEEVRSTTFVCRDNNIKFTFSAGVANCREAKDAPMMIDRLIEIADRRMYQAKRSGRNRIISKPMVTTAGNPMY